MVEFDFVHEVGLSEDRLKSLRSGGVAMEKDAIFYDAENFVSLPEAIPLERIVRVEPKSVYAKSSPHQLLKEALANPIKSRRFNDESITNAAVIFSDNTRLPSPYLTNLIQTLTEKTEDVKLIVASGTHVLPSHDYLKKTAGEVLRSCRVVFSSTRDNSCRFESVGETSRGTLVEINKEILDRVFVVSSLCVRPHYFAGFEGGSKAILPGCSSLKTTSRNHSYVIGNSYARELVLNGNPIREDINEVPMMLEKHGTKYRVADFVADNNDNPFKIAYGDPLETHRVLANASQDIYAVKAPETTLSITVADGSLGRNLYQATKAFILTTNVMKPSRSPKSTVVLVASLKDGIGSDTWANEVVHYSSMSSKDVIRDLEQRAKRGEFNETLQKINRFAIDRDLIDLRVVSPKAPKEVERLLNEVRIFFARKLDEALEDFHEFNENIILVPKGSSTVPIRTT